MGIGRRGKKIDIHEKSTKWSQMRCDLLPALGDNYTQAIVCSETNKALFVDTPDASVIVSYIEQQGVEPIALLNTHHHSDHAGGNCGVCERYPVVVYASEKDSSRVSGQVQVVKDGHQIVVGRLKFNVIACPGHTQGHIALYGQGALFCGDALFVGGCGRLFEGSPREMFESLSRFKALPDETLVYCGHEYTLNNLRFALTVEPENVFLQKKLQEVGGMRQQGLPTVPSTIGDEKKYNPFLRWDSPEILATLHGLRVKGLDDPVEVFAAVRRLKDGF